MLRLEIAVVTLYVGLLYTGPTINTQINLFFMAHKYIPEQKSPKPHFLFHPNSGSKFPYAIKNWEFLLFNVMIIINSCLRQVLFMLCKLVVCTFSQGKGASPNYFGKNNVIVTLCFNPPPPPLPNVTQFLHKMYHYSKVPNKGVCLSQNVKYNNPPPPKCHDDVIFSKIVWRCPLSVSAIENTSTVDILGW